MISKIPISRRGANTGAQAGFSLIELMIVILLLSVIMGAVFGQVDLVQKRFRTEQNKLDISQTAREFLDQIVRDVHKCGFPNWRQATLRCGSRAGGMTRSAGRSRRLIIQPVNSSSIAIA